MPINKPLEKNTVIRKQNEMLVIAKMSMKKKNSVPSDFSNTASVEPPYHRAFNKKIVQNNASKNS